MPQNAIFNVYRLSEPICTRVSAMRRSAYRRPRWHYAVSKHPALKLEMRKPKITSSYHQLARSRRVLTREPLIRPTRMHTHDCAAGMLARGAEALPEPVLDSMLLPIRSRK